MRRQVLNRSVERQLPTGARVDAAVFMWRREAWMIAGTLAGVAAMLAGLTLVDYGTVGTRVMIALAVGLIVAAAATENRVLAQTDEQLVMFRAGRFRQVAVDVIGPVSPSSIEMTSSNLVLTDWLVDGRSYTVPKRSQDAMTQMADAVVGR